MLCIAFSCFWGCEKMSAFIAAKLWNCHKQEKSNNPQIPELDFYQNDYNLEYDDKDSLINIMTEYTKTCEKPLLFVLDEETELFDRSG